MHGWEGDARGRSYGGICICIADSFCYKAETNTPLESNYSPIKMFKKMSGKVLVFLYVYIYIFKDGSQIGQEDTHVCQEEGQTSQGESQIGREGSKTCLDGEVRKSLKTKEGL